MGWQKDEVVSATPTAPKQESSGWHLDEVVQPAPKADNLRAFVMQEAAKRGIKPAIALKMVDTESSWDRKALSEKGAQGLMQLMPETAKEMGVKDPFDAKQNIIGGLDYYAKQLKDFGGDDRLALAAYNAGAGNVRKHKGVPPFKETQSYVDKILGAVGDQWDLATKSLPHNKMLSKKYLTENLAPSVMRFPAAVAAGTGQMVYDAAKTFTDPVVNAVSGKQSLGDAASNLFHAPSTAVRNLFGGMAEATAAPLGLSTQRTASEAWDDPAMATAAISPLADVGILGARSLLAKSPRQLAKGIANVVTKGFDRGVKPGFDGNKTFKQSQKYYQKANDAVSTIIANKDALALTDDLGETTTGKLPVNLKQFTQAIDQTKNVVFDKYNAMIKETGAQGASVPTTGIATELNTIATSVPIVDHAPGVAAYAAERAKALAERRQYTTAEAQESIAVLNRSLEAFYKNPSPDTAGRAFVDATIVNNLRKGLDSVIEAYSGPGYQELKNQYGALKAIEKDVNRRARVTTNAKGGAYTDFTHIFSGSEAVKGIMTANPSTVGMAASSEFISALIRRARDPNRKIAKMFEKAEALGTQLDNYQAPRSGMERLAENYITP